MHPSGWLSLAAILTASAGCGSTVTRVEPTPVKCAAALTAPAGLISDAGGTATVAIDAQPECPWAATSDAEWISILSPSSGQGPGEVRFSYSSNPTGTVREGGITVNSQRVTVRQLAACAFALSSSTLVVGASGGASEVSVSAPDSCQVTAQTTATWIAVQVTPAADGGGSAEVHLQIASNGTESSREAVVTIGTQTLTVQQGGASSGTPSPPGGGECTFALSPSSLAVGPAGGTLTATLTSSGSCSWSSTSPVAWVTMAPPSGSGSTTMTLDVAANGGATRSATITIAGQSLIISQSAVGGSGCSYSLSATSATVAAGGGSTAVSVTPGGSCGWSATSGVPWIDVASGATGTGPGTVSLTVAAHSGPSRQGTVTIAGFEFLITQSSGCAASLSPDSQAIGAAGGAGTAIAVSTAAGCTWSATASEAWISLAAPTTGAGDGTIAFSVSANSGPSRQGSIVVNGQTATVTQASGCSFTLSSTVVDANKSGESGLGVQVQTAAGCAWTASTQEPWITITSGASGSGNGTVTFDVAKLSGSSRAGQILIAGQVVTVNQGND